MTTPLRAYKNKVLHIDQKSISSIECNCNFCPEAVSCCSMYEVLLSEDEVTRIDEIMNEVIAYCPDLCCDSEFENVFAEEERDLYSLDKDEDGRCVFEYVGPRGENLCALHTVALDRGEDPFDRKPVVCSLWPLAFSEQGRLVTLSTDPDSKDFHCVDPHKGKVPDKEIDHIVKCFAELFQVVKTI